MLATMFLLGLLYVVLIAVLIAAGVGALTVAVIAGILFLVQYFSSDKLALYSMGAQQVSVEVTDHWLSSRRVRYPSAWHVTVPQVGVPQVLPADRSYR